MTEDAPFNPDDAAAYFQRQFAPTTAPLEHLSLWEPGKWPTALVSGKTRTSDADVASELKKGSVIWAHYSVPSDRTLNLELEYGLDTLLAKNAAFDLSVVAAADSAGQAWPGQFNGIVFDRVDFKPEVMRPGGWACAIVAVYAAEGCLFTFAQPTRWLPDADEGDDAAVVRAAIETSRTPFEIDGLYGSLEFFVRAWREHNGRTATDLALCVLSEVAYQLRAVPDRLRDQLDVLQATALTRVTSLASGVSELPGDLADVPRTFFEFDRRTRRLERLVWPTVTTIEDGDALFGATPEHPVTRLLIRRHRFALSHLQAVRTEARAAADSFASSVAAQQLVLSFRQEQEAAGRRLREQRFARDATIIASLVLMPTLVTSFFGANVTLPFGGRTAAILMVALMILLATGMYAYLRWRHPQSDERS